MKKVLIIISMFILITGCTNKKVLESEMKKVTNQYYEENIKNKVKGLDTLEITLGDLRSIKNSKLDLSKLDKCSDDTKIKVNIKNNKLSNYEISLKCN